MARIDMPEGANVAVPGVYSLVPGALSNKGNPTSGGFNNLMVVEQNQPVRIVDGGGNVIFEGIGPDAARQAVQIGQNISDTEGNKAAWNIQTVPVGTSNFKTIASEVPNASVLGKIADVALPVIGGLINPILGAAAGSALSSAAQGRSLGDTLVRAGLAGGGAALGGAIAKGGDAFAGGVSDTASNAVNAAYQAAQQGAGSALSGIYGSALGSAAGSAAGSTAGALGGLVGDIIVTGARNTLPSFAGGALGSLGGSIVPSFFDSAQLSDMQTTSRQPYSQQTDGGDIIVNAPTGTPVNLDPGSLLGSVAGSFVPSVTNPPVDGGDIVVTGKVNPPPSLTESLLSGAASTVLPELGPKDTPTNTTSKDKNGILGTGADLSDVLAIGGLLGGLLGGGGSGTTGAGTPYVSPFGAGGTMAGDFRASPAIGDYERYGFGPEASFFRPEYYGLVSGGASKGYTPTAMTTTPTYTPLISGGGGSTTTGVATTGGTTGGATAVTKQERPAGFTGVVVGQQVGDTQVVDGTTWVWGGDNVGWQMQYKSPETGNLALLPGNGATNVSSFANNPTVEVNQPYFAQNTANIPGWATTYQGFQQGLMGAGVTGDAKAAAERELFSAIETQPFANAQSLVDYARGIYSKYTNPQSTSLI